MVIVPTSLKQILLPTLVSRAGIIDRVKEGIQLFKWSLVAQVRQAMRSDLSVCVNDTSLSLSLSLTVGIGSCVWVSLSSTYKYYLQPPFLFFADFSRSPSTTLFRIIFCVCRHRVFHNNGRLFIFNFQRPVHLSTIKMLCILMYILWGYFYYYYF